MMLIHKIKATRDFRGDKKMSVDDVTKLHTTEICSKKQPMSGNNFLGVDDDDDGDDDDDSVDDKQQVCCHVDDPRLALD